MYIIICIYVQVIVSYTEDIYFVVFFIKEKTTYSNNFNITSLPILAIVLKILKFTKKCFKF